MYAIDNASVMCYVNLAYMHVVPTPKAGASEKQKLGVTLLGRFCVFHLARKLLSLIRRWLAERARARAKALCSALLALLIEVLIPLPLGGERSAMQTFFCDKCGREFLSQPALAGHISRKHPKTAAGAVSSGYSRGLHNIVQGYGHKCEDGRVGKVYDCYTETDEGCIFRWRCVNCDKILKEWFEKWTPDSKERVLAEKRGEHTRYDPFKHFPAARNLATRRL